MSFRQFREKDPLSKIAANHTIETCSKRASEPLTLSCHLSQQVAVFISWACKTPHRWLLAVCTYLNSDLQFTELSPGSSTSLNHPAKEPTNLHQKTITNPFSSPFPPSLTFRAVRTQDVTSTVLFLFTFN